MIETVVWKVENFSYCSQTYKSGLESPKFYLSESYDSKCCLKIYPRGSTDSTLVGIYLIYEYSSLRHIDFVIFSLIGSDDCVFKTLHLKCDEFDRYNLKFGTAVFISRDELFQRKADYLPGDVLTISCRVLMTNIVSVTQRVFLRSRVNVEKVSCISALEKFGTLENSFKKSISKLSGFDKALSGSLNLVGDSLDVERIELRLALSERSKVAFATCKVSLLDVLGMAITVLEDEHFFEFSDSVQIWNLPHSISKKKLLSRESDYLPKDVLTLLIECAFTTGHCTKEVKYTLKKQPVSDAQECAQGSLKRDMQFMFEEGINCDLRLRAGSESLPVHKAVLTARSSVFRAMLESDMKESANGFVDIFDLDKDTLHQMVFFMYTDTLKGLLWDSSLRLYYAADKYAITALKQECLRYISSRLSLSNICEILILAYLHQDGSLKKAAYNFIIEQGNAVVDSQEWKDLEKNYPKLALETFHQIYGKSFAY